MKLRNGFISNSSSSSFIISTGEHEKIWTEMGHKVELNKIATDEDIKKLIEYGFKPRQDEISPTCLELAYPVDLDYTETIDINNTGKTPECYYYQVVCNEDNVLYFLIKNNIPFKASTHYGHETYIYERNSDIIWHMENIGVACEMYTDMEKRFKLFKNEPLMKQINKAEWLAEEDKYQKETKDED